MLDYVKSTTTLGLWFAVKGRTTLMSAGYLYTCSHSSHSSSRRQQHLVQCRSRESRSQKVI